MTAFTYLGVSLSRKQRNKVTACCTKASFLPYRPRNPKNLDSLKYLPYLIILNGFIVIIILQRLFTQTANCIVRCVNSVCSNIFCCLYSIRSFSFCSFYCYLCRSFCHFYTTFCEFFSYFNTFFSRIKFFFRCIRNLCYNFCCVIMNSIYR